MTAVSLVGCTMSWLNFSTFQRNLLPPSSGWLNLFNQWMMQKPKSRLINNCHAYLKTYMVESSLQSTWSLPKFHFNNAAHPVVSSVATLHKCSPVSLQASYFPMRSTYWNSQAPHNFIQCNKPKNHNWTLCQSSSLCYFHCSPYT